MIASGTATFSLNGGFAANGYAAHSPGGYTVGAAFTAEFALTFMFLMIILWSNGPARARWLCPDCDRSWVNADTSDRDTGHQSFRESRTQHWSGNYRRRLGFAATVAVLACAVGWSARRRAGVSVTRGGSGECQGRKHRSEKVRRSWRVLADATHGCKFRLDGVSVPWLFEPIHLEPSPPSRRPSQIAKFYFFRQSSGVIADDPRKQESEKMTIRCLPLAATASVLVLSLTSANADTFNKKTKLTFSHPSAYQEHLSCRFLHFQAR